MLSKCLGFLLFLLSGTVAEAVDKFTNKVLNKDSYSRLYSRGGQDLSFVFSLQRYEKGTWVHWCTATVLNEKYLLTAAQCLYQGECKNVEDEYCTQFQPFELRVVSGRRTTLSLPGMFTSYELQSYHIHPSFDTTESAKADIALLRVKEKLEVDGLNIEGVQLGAPKDQNLSKGDATIFRWDSADGEGDAKLRASGVSLVSHDKCREQYNTQFMANYHPKMMGCMKSFTGLPACHGYAGSPVIFDRRLVGIWFVAKDARCVRRKTFIYVSVPAYLEWINGTAKSVWDSGSM